MCFVIVWGQSREEKHVTFFDATSRIAARDVSVCLWPKVTSHRSKRKEKHYVFFDREIQSCIVLVNLPQ